MRNSQTSKNVLSGKTEKYIAESDDEDLDISTDDESFNKKFVLETEERLLRIRNRLQKVTKCVDKFEQKFVVKFF